jgi:hypothetical protein
MDSYSDVRSECSTYLSLMAIIEPYNLSSLGLTVDSIAVFTKPEESTNLTALIRRSVALITSYLLIKRDLAWYFYTNLLFTYLYLIVTLPY